MKLILASASPRRLELLRHTYLPFEVIPSKVDEIIDSKIPSEVVLKLSYDKAFDVFKDHPNALIIGADTIVYLNGKILGKPTNRQDAKSMLLSLSGKVHEVFTGISLLGPALKDSFFVKTEVTFKKIPEDLLTLYLDSKEPYDKAGSYGIQGAALAFIESIKGSYSNVVGLPVDQVLFRIEELLIPKFGSQWRNVFLKD